MRAAIAAANREERDAREMAQQADRAGRAAAASTMGWEPPESDEERRRRLAQERAARDRAAAKRKRDPGQAMVDDVVSAEAQAHGLYGRDTVPGPPIVKKGKEVPTTLTVVRNRGGTTIERWLALGALDKRQAEAIAFYCRTWSLFFSHQRVTANWGLVATFRGGSIDFEAFARTQLHAKKLLAWLDEEVFFFVGLQRQEIWRNVVLFDEPAGVAGGRLGFKSKQAEAVAKDVVRFVADAIANALNLGEQRPASEWLGRP